MKLLIIIQKLSTFKISLNEGVTCFPHREFFSETYIAKHSKEKCDFSDHAFSSRKLFRIFFFFAFFEAIPQKWKNK